MTAIHRRVCFKKYPKECLFCNEQESVEVHHVNGDETDNSAENLIPVCREHHEAIHCGEDGFEKWSDELDSLWTDSSGTSTEETNGIHYRIEDMDDEVWQKLKSDTPRTMKIEERLEQVLREYYDV